MKKFFVVALALIILANVFYLTGIKESLTAGQANTDAMNEGSNCNIKMTYRSVVAQSYSYLKQVQDGTGSGKLTYSFSLDLPANATNIRLSNGNGNPRPFDVELDYYYYFYSRYFGQINWEDSTTNGGVFYKVLDAAGGLLNPFYMLTVANRAYAGSINVSTTQNLGMTWDPVTKKGTISYQLTPKSRTIGGTSVSELNDYSLFRLTESQTEFSTPNAGPGVLLVPLKFDLEYDTSTACGLQIDEDPNDCTETAIYRSVGYITEDELERVSPSNPYTYTLVLSGIPREIYNYYGSGKNLKLPLRSFKTAGKFGNDYLHYTEDRMSGQLNVSMSQDPGNTVDWTNFSTTSIANITKKYEIKADYSGANKPTVTVHYDGSNWIARVTITKFETMDTPPLSHRFPNGAFRNIYFVPLAFEFQYDTKQDCNGSGEEDPNMKPECKPTGDMIGGGSTGGYDGILQCNNTGGSYSFNDSENWEECIFDQEGHYESYWGNQYCPVYCREDYETDFPTALQAIKAGQRFTWEPISVGGNRNCKSQIRLEKWYKDFNKNEEELRENYNRYQATFEQAAKASGSMCNGGFIMHWPSARFDGTLEPGGSGGCDDDPPLAVLYGNRQYYYNAWQQGLKDREDLFTLLGNCYNWKEKGDPYYLDTEIDMEYDDSKYGDRFELDVKDNKTSEFKKCDRYTTIKYYRCNEGGRNEKDKKCILSLSRNVCYMDEMTVDSTFDQKYSMQEYIYRYVLKPEGISIHLQDLGNYPDHFYNNAYYDIGYPNFPVNFQVKTGTYPIRLWFRNIGYQNYFDRYIDSKYSSPYQYECSYDVENDILNEEDKPGGGGGVDPNVPGCEPGDTSCLLGLNVIYRPIDVNTRTQSFPGQNGTGRYTGSNWTYDNNFYDYYDYSKGSLNTSGNDLVNTYINNARGYKGDSIYSAAPIYSFKLTPSVIQNIKQYNKEQGYQYDNFDMHCDSNGKNCLSKFLQDKSAVLSAGGLCNGVSNYTGATGYSNFDLCRYGGAN